MKHKTDRIAKKMATDLWPLGHGQYLRLRNIPDAVGHVTGTLEQHTRQFVQAVIQFNPRDRMTISEIDHQRLDQFARALKDCQYLCREMCENDLKP